VTVITASLTSHTQVSPRLSLLTLDVRGTALTFEAGQALLVAPHGHTPRRPYSIASSPAHAADTGQIELLIAAGEHGLPWATPGALVDVEGPVGAFRVPHAAADAHLLFVAGGTGIAPIHAMLDEVIRRRPAVRPSLLYSARTSHEFAFLDDFRAWERAGRLEVHLTVTRHEPGWHGRRGRVGREHFEAVLHDAGRTVCVLCGPAALVEDASAMLGTLGVGPESLHRERWGAPRATR
jgi:NAD(P)H-flavin reductase